MFLEHYLPCGHCEWDHMGEYRHCAATEWFYDPKAIRYGYTSTDIAPALWGGFSHYLYLPLERGAAQGARRPDARRSRPRDADVQRHPVGARSTAASATASTVLIQGPGQQGLCCVMASKQAGADSVIVTGTSQGRAAPRGGEGAGRRRRDRRRDGRSARAHPGSHRRPRRRRRHRLHGRRPAPRRRCSASRRRSAAAARWWCRAKATRSSPTSRSAG